jgi:uncharacterized protein (UPF0371 family)
MKKMEKINEELKIVEPELIKIIKKAKLNYQNWNSRMSG